MGGTALRIWIKTSLSVQCVCVCVLGPAKRHGLIKTLLDDRGSRQTDSFFLSPCLSLG